MYLALNRKPFLNSNIQKRMNKVPAALLSWGETTEVVCYISLDVYTLKLIGASISFLTTWVYFGNKKKVGWGQIR